MPVYIHVTVLSVIVQIIFLSLYYVQHALSCTIHILYLLGDEILSSHSESGTVLASTLS